MEEAFYRFMKAIDLEQFREMHQSEWGSDVSYSDILYLFIINHKEQTTVSELSEQMSVSRPAVTQKINDLEQLGLVKKIQSEEDKRYFYISLTDKVKESSASTRTDKVLDVVSECFSEEELEVFTKILNVMADYILEER